FVLLMSVMSTSLFLNESLQKASVRYLTICFHGTDKDAIRRFFHASWAMSMVFGLVITFCVLIGAPFLISLFNISSSLSLQAIRVMQIAAFSHGVVSILQPWTASLLAQDRYTLNNVLNTLQQFLILFGLVLLSFIPVNFAGGPLVQLAIVWLGPAVLIPLGTAAYVNFRSPLLRLNFKFLQWNECKQVISLGGWSTVVGLGSSLYERLDQIIINLFLGPVFNTFYGVVVQLENYVSRIVTALSEVILPTATRLGATGSRWEKQQLIVRATRYALTLALPCAGSIIVFRREIIEIWLGKGFAEAIYILPLAMLLMSLRVPMFITWPYLTAVNKLKWPAVALLIDALINVPLSILYLKIFHLGLFGVVLGTLSTNVVRFVFFQSPYIARQIEMPVWKYWNEAYTRPLVSAILFFAILFGIEWSSPSIIVTALAVALASAFYALSTWYWILEEYEQNLFLGIVRNLSFRKLSTDSSVA
ncbi:MAG: hypothetical protein ACRD63_08285, partial [Pyrinomonadaceae bacterium]